MQIEYLQVFLFGDTEIAGSHLTDSDDPAYSFKPSVMGAVWELKLTPAALEWRAGHRNGKLPYGDIRRVRLSFRIGSLASRDFRAEVWGTGSARLDIASTSRKSVVVQNRQDAEYKSFIAALHRRLNDHGTRASFESGLPPFVYWLGLALFVVVALAMAGLVVRALQTSAWPAALFIGAFLALSLWQLGNFYRRNRPGFYRPDALPAGVLPD